MTWKLSDSTFTGGKMDGHVDLSATNPSQSRDTSETSLFTFLIR